MVCYLPDIFLHSASATHEYVGDGLHQDRLDTIVASDGAAAVV